MAQISAGLLLFRRRAPGVEFFLVHPGGPFWARKDDGAWSIPKGLCAAGEDRLAAARREFAEEVGQTIDGDFVELGAFRQPGGKTVVAWLVEGSVDPTMVRSNTFDLEWPPHSGKIRSFPEVDRADWFAPDVATRKVTKGQRPIVEAACRGLGIRPAGS
jgi:predicted NUDIX family NTP pyrophosphohydrolase